MKISKRVMAILIISLMIANSSIGAFAAEIIGSNDVAGQYSFKTTAPAEKKTENNEIEDLCFFVTFTFNGQSYDLSGNGSMLLSELLCELNISYNISDVVSVSLSDPTILEITKVDSDWELKSTGSFGSEHTLTISFSDGNVIEILVKDPIVYNYVIDSSITNVPLSATESRIITNITDAGKNSFQNFIGTGFKSNSQNIANPTGSGSVDMIVYASPGMAIRFAGGNNNWSSTPGNTGTDIWYWFWGKSRPSNSTADEYSNFAILKEGTEGKSVKFSFKVNSLTVNVTLCSVATYTSQQGTDAQANLLQNNLPDGYSIKSLPITLYDYDGKKFNSYYENLDGNYFAFHSFSQGVDAKGGLKDFGWASGGPNTGVNTGGDAALMGIVKENLVNGLPVMSQGQNVDLFSTNAVNGKTVYENVNFQFIYNERTGYYTYNSSLNHAQYNSEKNTVELYKQSLAPADSVFAPTEKNDNAGFYPFEDITKSFTNPGYTPISESEWLAKLNSKFELTPGQYSSDIVNTKCTDPVNSTVNMHFGLQLACDFYLPQGKQINGQDMIFNFTGDDDLWVFIDDKLVLDIGGGHTQISGNFNLTTGKVYVESYAQLHANGGGSYAVYKRGFNLSVDSTVLTGLEEDQMHNIKIFYLERHSGVSNCYMNFNLPVIPSNSVSISKDLVNHEGNKLSVTPDVMYDFVLFTAEDTDDNGDATDFSKYKNAPYTLIGDGVPEGTQYTDENGVFKLKSGWMARFLDIPRFTNVYVVELTPNDGYIYTNSTLSVNRGTEIQYNYGEATEKKVIQSNLSIEFAFVNYIKTQSLIVEKQVENGTQGLINPDMEFVFNINFTKPILETGENEISANDKSGGVVTLTNNGSFQLGHSESVTIPRVPVNMTFALQEANPDVENGSFDAPKFIFENCTTTDTPNSFDTNYTWTVADSGENKIVVKNQQRFNLTVSKTGISDIDHNSNEQQSTIYTIVGKIGENEIVRMNVVICGNDSVTICGLPVGTYTVEENADWAWRYESVNGYLEDVNIPQNAQASVAYENRRKEDFWNSGDCYVENWFTPGEIKKRNGENEVTN